jgi:integrase
MIEGATKTGRARVVDLDAATVARLRDYRARRWQISEDLVADAALVLGRLDGSYRHPERFSRQFFSHLKRARKDLGAGAMPRIRLNDLRHTHPTLLLGAGVPVKIVSERLGHASATITLAVYAHVHPGMGQEAAALFGQLLDGGANGN